MKEFGHYDRGQYLIPLWKGNVVYGESACVIENALGEIPPVRLAYPIRKAISVKSADLSFDYEEGKDFRVNEYGELCILRGGKIPFLPWKNYRLPAFDPKDDKQIAASDGIGAYLLAELFADREGMRAFSLAVTYEHEESAEYDLTAGKREKFKRLLKKLEGGAEVKIVSYGDSITYGWGASGLKDVQKPPFCKPYAEMTVEELQARFASEIRHVNLSVSGKCADWAAERENLQALTAENPDLVILAFGMNDAVAIRPEDFKKNLLTIIRTVRKSCPQTEFLLLSSILPNPLVGFSSGSSIYRYHREYPRVLSKIEREEEGIGYANVTAVHERLLERKALADTLSNNANHPNDFMHRVYAQTALRTLLGKEF